VMRWAYRRVSRPPAGEDAVAVAEGVAVPQYVVDYAQQGEYEARRFLRRLEPWLDLEGKTVLDVGCGAGALCVEAARRGAERVVGVEVAPDYVTIGQAHLERLGAISERVELRRYGGDPSELGVECFDVVLSKDTFEHYGALPSTPDAEAMVGAMMRLLRPGGRLAIGFGPLWHAPYGGHIDSWLPWAHLIFPEEVIFEEFRRVRPDGYTARSFEEGVGVNRMSEARFNEIMERSGLRCLHLAANVGDRRLLRVMDVLRQVPSARRFMTQNIYGVWERPAASAGPPAGADQTA
jgi:SAM-dependent methyltransferase